MNYIRAWKVSVRINGFDTLIFIEGTEEELRAYIDSELDYRYYIGASDKEVETAKALKLPIYLAPTINR